MGMGQTAAHTMYNIYHTVLDDIWATMLIPGKVGSKEEVTNRGKLG